MRYAAPTPTGSTTNATCNPNPCELRRAIFTVGQAGDEIVVAPGTYDETTWQATYTAPKPNMNIHGVLGQARPSITVGAASDNVFGSREGDKFRHLQLESETDYANPIAAQAPNVLQEDLVLIATGRHGTAAVIGGGGLLRDTAAYAPGRYGQAVRFGRQGNEILSLRNVTALAPGSHGHAIYGRTNSSGACANPISQTVLFMKNVIALGGGGDIALDPDATCPTRYPLSLYAGNSNFRGVLYDFPGKKLLSIGGNQSGLPDLRTEASAPAYHQDPGSITINAGVADGLLGAADLDGQSRILGGTPDIGADEAAG